jgi:hypothetical protein
MPKTHEDGDGPCCWICLSAEGALSLPCACPRPVHALCLGRWQLQQAGRPEERACRFCGETYGDWGEGLGGGVSAVLPAGASPSWGVAIGGGVQAVQMPQGSDTKDEDTKEFCSKVGYSWGTRGGAPGGTERDRLRSRRPNGAATGAAAPAAAPVAAAARVGCQVSLMRGTGAHGLCSPLRLFPPPRIWLYTDVLDTPS